VSIISIPFTFSPGGTIVSSQVNSCLSVIYNDYNGNVGNSNLSSSIVITDSKLAQITSASKVSATALTGLASTPSGAGVIPAANLPSQYASSIILNAYNTATQSITNTTWTQRTFGTVLKDSNSYWASNTFTPLTAGYYFVNYIDAVSLTPGANIAVAIYKNGSLYAENICQSNTTGNCSANVSTVVQANGSTDYFQFYIYHSEGSSANAQGSGFSFVSIFRVF